MSSTCTRLSIAALALSGLSCLDDPKLKGCADFPAGTDGCPSSRCEVYCDLVTASCPDVFASKGTCLAECVEENLEPGSLNDAEGDTLECRIEYAQRAADDPAECAAAGVEGNLVCRDDLCARYCEQMAESCPAAYPVGDYCTDICNQLPRGGDSGNTLECRMAALADGDCDGAHTNGTGRCGEPCEMYCTLAMRNCTDQLALYADRGECEAHCALLKQDGTHDDWDGAVEGDTVQCRTYHLGLPAALAPDVHCHHAGLFDGDHCGDCLAESPESGPKCDACTTFCDLVDQHCPEAFADRAVCETFCEREEELPVPGIDACDRLR